MRSTRTITTRIPWRLDNRDYGHQLGRSKIRCSRQHDRDATAGLDDAQQQLRSQVRRGGAGAAAGGVVGVIVGEGTVGGGVAGGLVVGGVGGAVGGGIGSLCGDALGTIANCSNCELL